MIQVIYRGRGYVVDNCWSLVRVLARVAVAWVEYEFDKFAGIP